MFHVEHMGRDSSPLLEHDDFIVTSSRHSADDLRAILAEPDADGDEQVDAPRRPTKALEPAEPPLEAAGKPKKPAPPAEPEKPAEEAPVEEPAEEPEEEPAPAEGEPPAADAEAAAKAAKALPTGDPKAGKTLSARGKTLMAEIHQLTAQKYAEKKEAEQLRAEVARLRAEHAELAKPPAEEKAKKEPAAPVSRPTVDKYESYDGYTEAGDDWTLEESKRYTQEQIDTAFQREREL